MKPVFTLAIFLCLSLFISLNSCKKSPNDGIPIYMRMDSVGVNYQGKPLNPEGITDVWVEANADNLGAYELPINFPVLQEGQVRFVVSAGVWESGQPNVRDIYPFYDADTFSIPNAVRGTKYSHHPAFTYKNGVSFAINENFEFNNDYDTVLKKVPYPTDSGGPYRGSGFGEITVTNTDTDRTSVQTSGAFPLPAGQEIWLEMDYKCDVPFWVGIIGNISGTTPTATHVEFLLPKSYWNKEYIKLSNLVGNIRADNYQLYFEAIKPIGGDPGSVYLDNIKVVHQ